MVLTTPFMCKHKNVLVFNSNSNKYRDGVLLCVTLILMQLYSVSDTAVFFDYVYLVRMEQRELFVPHRSLGRAEMAAPVWGIDMCFSKPSLVAKLPQQAVKFV